MPLRRLQRTRAAYAEPRDGIFERDGERWIRERGREHRLLDLAPHCEARYQQDRIATLARAIARASARPTDGDTHT
jgi:hypothetical protein